MLHMLPLTCISQDEHCNVVLGAHTYVSGLKRSYLSSAELHIDGVQLRLVLQLAVTGEGGLGGSKPCLHVKSWLTLSAFPPR